MLSETSLTMTGHLAHDTALLTVCARKGRGKAPSPDRHPQSPVHPAPCLPGLGLLSPFRSGKGLYFLDDLGRSRIKKYFLFKYEGG